MVGEGIRYDTCTRRGVITDALTNFTEARQRLVSPGQRLAGLQLESDLRRRQAKLPAATFRCRTITLPGREVKWVSQNVLVARPVVLYVRDVPVLWLPFLFQDMRPGRHSGILIPQFGFNDLVRTNPGYNRQIANIGYYWAPNDYIDLTARLDWYSNRYLQYGIAGSYNWINRFVDGAVAFSRQLETDGGSSATVRWDHRQTFNLSTSLNLDLNYASNTSIINRNAVDPLLNTQQITSSLNFSKRYGWGTLTIGGNRRQSLSDGSVQQLLPAVTISPASIAIGSFFTWSPGFSFTNNTESKTPLDSLLTVLPGNILDTVAQVGGRRTTTLDFQTPLRLGNFNWQNSLSAVDQRSTGRDSSVVRLDNPTTPDPTDSITLTRIFNGNFSTGVDWNTGINLPVLFRGSWKVQPALGVANTTSSGPFLIRNRNTNGDFVHQGKRFRFSATASPTLFAFLPGFGFASRIRHSLSPNLSWNYSPAASVPLEYAQAIQIGGQPLQLRSDATQTMSLGLSQTFEAKAKRASGDTSDAEARKFRVLSINTTPISYDFEQAKKPGRTGWTTPSITNSLLSDLLPQFTLSFTHDLWRGPVGVDTSKFDPFLSNVSASFAISGNTLRSIGSIFGLGKGPSGRRENVPSSYVVDAGRRNRSFYNSGRVPFSGGGREFTANFNYTLSRTRPVPWTCPVRPGSRTWGSAPAFRPLLLDAVLVVAVQHYRHRVRISGGPVERQLHEWRAGFNFTRNANGNFAFYFSIYLTDLPDLKFDYNQTTFDE